MIKELESIESAINNLSIATSFSIKIEGYLKSGSSCESGKDKEYNISFVGAAIFSLKDQILAEAIRIAKKQYTEKIKEYEEEIKLRRDKSIDFLK